MPRQKSFVPNPSPANGFAISGIGGLGHVAVQSAKAMGLHVVALDFTDEKLALARQLGAEVTVNANAPDAAAQVIKVTGGGAHGALVTACCSSSAIWPQKSLDYECPRVNS